MAQVSEKVLSWLYSVLHEYNDPQRTYSDAARILSAYTSISPRTEVYTYDNGTSALLLTLSGTLPVDFRGTTYRFPIKLWIPQAYPQEAPIAYVNPGIDMLIRPGQHVGVDGRVYHPYLRDWERMWDRASVAEFLGFLQQVFAKEPPVISKAHQQQYYQRQSAVRPTGHGASPAPPRLPPKQRVGDADLTEMSPMSTPGPPARPPKPGEERVDSYPQRTSSRNVARDGPPLPPLPHNQREGESATLRSHQNHNASAGHMYQSSYQNGRPPGPQVPPLPAHSERHHEHLRSQHNRSPVSPVSPVNGFAKPADYRYSHLPPPPPPHYAQQQPHYQPSGQPAPPLDQRLSQQQGQFHAQQQRYSQAYQHPPSQPRPYQAQQTPAKQPQKVPAPDLLSDPFDVALPGPGVTGPPAPAPPIPPNPEKEHLLHAISTSLVQQAQAKVNQNLSALAPLQAQHAALRSAYQNLQNEIRTMEALSQTLNINEQILRRNITDCDRTIATAKTKPQPNIDEVLVAPTVVAQQLWNACADVAAAKEAMYVLQKAVDQGRISGQDFVRQMRALGREVFARMVLARKCARGLGLEM
ncbi:hypothetical protein BAUCODRAFT_65568 [Baudoinia panamericana UAMH 10762]|uniref:UEV domain-containing protein n=1 Tax=Baudoinia panamericana (strain UAMH 10762) TaxID=717646 RepID=M2MQX5_BAUPA|nr:uncharacterized protein BAUCODRAFT_65568 [Baudoinia panamericana UAMH 10762]EMC99236.1 hypothetical protein BAUCODRAFT_65568 [Baudoinia panamericana UAMH 10762]